MLLMEAPRYLLEAEVKRQKQEVAKKLTADRKIPRLVIAGSAGRMFA
jgi:hypothetical protein